MILYHKCIEKKPKMRIINICATIAQLAECILGKDEVTGPTPVGGSIFEANHFDLLFLLRFYYNFNTINTNNLINDKIYVIGEVL